MNITRLKLLFSLACAASLLTAGPATGQEQTPVPSGTQEHNNVRPAIKWKRTDYTCENNTKITVYIHDSYAKVRTKDQLYVMRQTPSADGARYSDGKVAWWSRGDDGFLQEDTPDGEGQKLVKDCYVDKAATDESASASVTVTGTLTYLARIALPPQAVIHVQLVDLSSTNPPAMVSEQKFTLGQRGVPVPFELKVAAAKIDPSHFYGISARISVAGEVRFASKGPAKVLTQGNPSEVDLVLLPAVTGKAVVPAS